MWLHVSSRKFFRLHFHAFKTTSDLRMYSTLIHGIVYIERFRAHKLRFFVMSDTH